jgi:exodeoxyribonuclease VII large subunit
MPDLKPKEIFTVSRLNRSVRGLLEDVFDQVWVEGEISNLRHITSGHWYFSLKDSSAQVSCAMFKGQNRKLRFAPHDGMQVLIRGRVGLYEARGNYQIVVDQMQQGGEGALLRAFQQLKQRLDAEGLFADQHKQPLPALPRRIGVITSAGGAALHDVLSVLKRRFPAIPVLVYPSAVQGAEAPPQLRAALASAIHRGDCDVLLLTRGGGSLEDLWAFNDEALARAIHACPIPIISAVGHQIDFTIADFVADQRAATPSAAAELLSPDQRAWQAQLLRYGERLIAAIAQRLSQQQRQTQQLQQRLRRAHPGRQLEARAQRLDEIAQRLNHAMRNQLHYRRVGLQASSARLQAQNPAQRIARQGEHVGNLERRLRSAIHGALQQRRQRLDGAVSTLNVVSPLATLERGYSIITRDADKQLITDSGQLKPGEHITARLGSGEIGCRVETSSTAETAPAGQ